MPVCAPKVEVAIVVERSETVPYAKPDSVASAPPVAVMEPFRVRVEVATDVGRSVERVGTQAVVVKVASEP